MSTERLLGLALVSIEHTDTKELINYEKVIETFANMKKRKIILSLFVGAVAIVSVIGSFYIFYH